jgi:hypothetical protein
MAIALRRQKHILGGLRLPTYLGLFLLWMSRENLYMNRGDEMWHVWLFIFILPVTSATPICNTIQLLWLPIKQDDNCTWTFYRV